MHNQPRCPICDLPVGPSMRESAPFCSPRCRQIDLGRWLSERYSVPVERLDDVDPELGLTDDE